MDIPIIVICYNNYKYVDNTIRQIKKINENYYKNIFIMNNCSTCPKTIDYLNRVDVKIINRPENLAPHVDSTRNVDLFNQLPDKFVLTDPDLEFNENLPSNFIDILIDMSEVFKCYRVGFALDISDSEKMYQGLYFCNQSIYDWEKQFWINKHQYNNIDVYYVPLDTTFALINKKYNFYTSLRVASNFTAKHLPWYYDSKVINIYDKYLIYINTDKISTIKSQTIQDINENYEKVNKNDEFFFINKNDENITYWRDVYFNWERKTFDILDRYLSKDKILIDIGAWIGSISMYGSRKSKYVYSVEADNRAYKDLCLNMKNNCDNNYTLINKAIYNVDDTFVNFGKNKYLSNSKLNDSTSQIYLNNDDTNDYKIETISVNRLIKDVDINDISIIKVDIEGGEEFILNDLLELYSKHKIPMYVSFHYDWWHNKDLNRFDLLTDENKNHIIRFPFGSILFP